MIADTMTIFIQVTYKEIDEMIQIVDKNRDGKVNYSEFRVSSN